MSIPGKQQLKILYLAPANYTGTLNLFVEEHRRRGHVADFVTLTRSPEGFDNGICFDLWPNAGHKTLLTFRNLLLPNSNIKGEREELPGTPPFYKTSPLHALFLKLQDSFYGKRIRSMIEKHGLLDYDIYHLESGIDFFKDFRTLPLLKKNGKKLIANYHGSDFRNRGVHPIVHELADANLTSEWDVYFRYPGCHYLHLPFKIQNDFIADHQTDRVVIAHMARSKELFYYKGTREIIQCAEEAIKGRNAEFRLICGLPFAEVQTKLRAVHILIDQIGGKAGWGYGMSAVEALSRGIIVCVEIQREIEGALAGHPFVNVNRQSLTESLISLIGDTSRRMVLSKASREWATKTHSIRGVVDRLYGIYKERLCAVL
jgi:hypothetical protein